MTVIVVKDHAMYGNGNGHAQQPVYLTVREVAERWGVDPMTVKRRIKSGKLAAIRVSDRGDLRILVTEVERYELQNKVND
jgi:excisionase family DNA binding protein